MIASTEGTSLSCFHQTYQPFLSELIDQVRAVGREQQQIDFDELGVGELEELLDNQDTKLDEVLRIFAHRYRRGSSSPLLRTILVRSITHRNANKGSFLHPKPVSRIIVRSVHELLQTEFGLQDGLADTTTWGDMANRNEDLEIPERWKPEDPFVQILDPATGTATFLVETIGVIYQAMIKRWESESETGTGIPEPLERVCAWHLLPRLHGYELMMAPYAIAHMKIGIKLYETGYRFKANERLVFTCQMHWNHPAIFKPKWKRFHQLWLTANAVNEVKHNKEFTQWCW